MIPIYLTQTKHVITGYKLSCFLHVAVLHTHVSTLNKAGMTFTKVISMSRIRWNQCMHGYLIIHTIKPSQVGWTHS